MIRKLLHRPGENSATRRLFPGLRHCRTEPQGGTGDLGRLRNRAWKISNDGINGLSRAFTQAGVSTLLMSLWKVPEERTTVLMRGFHHYWLQEKQGKAASLQSTQRAFLKSETYRIQPNLWAGFVLLAVQTNPGGRRP